MGHTTESSEPLQEMPTPPPPPPTTTTTTTATVHIFDDTVADIKSRYIYEKAIYTWCGVALVAVNPYQEQDIYGEQVIETYHSASHSAGVQLEPHIYAVNEDAYSRLDRNTKNQSLIVSGESGAGKTVTAKHSMRYLASIASNLRIENRVLASNPIMEAIGNASTVRNDNSSRFGKYIKIFFERQSRKILGANMQTYLLEKSRVTKQQDGERNFHIFYQLLNYAVKNPQKMAHLKLVDPGDTNRIHKFKFLAGIEPQDQRDDLRRFNEALRTLNIDQSRVDMIYRILAGILHGGNIIFKPLNEEEDLEGPCCVEMDEKGHFAACCELIGLEPRELGKRLTIKLLRSGRDIIEQPQSKLKAEYSRDAMLKYIYECLFSWLVALINLSLSFDEPSAMVVVPRSPSAKKSILDQQQANKEPLFIGVLDIYGFENFKVNSFEQFCINYANEVLQQQYNQHVFKVEQEEYIREGIDWTFVEYSDNKPVIDIIESRPIGILNLLDEECKMPKGNDKSWCAKLYDQLMPAKSQFNNDTANQRFKRPKIHYQTSFIIGHYAEDVQYHVETFLEKNRDTIGEEQCEMLSRSEVLSFIFEDPSLASSVRPKAKSSRSATVGWQFRGSLAALIETLNATEPHYIRCIKPNDEKKAFKFNDQRAIQQLKACGIYETIKIGNNGFPSRWSYKDFAKRYYVLVYGTPGFERLSLAKVEPICEAICKIAYEEPAYKSLRTKEEQNYIDTLIQRHGNKPSAIYQFGKTKIFFRAGQVGYLERIRGQRLREYTVTIQRHIRGWLARKSFIRRRGELLEQMRREASLVSLQSQVNSLQTELEQVKEEREDLVVENVSRLGSLYQLVVEMMYASIQPLITGALLEYEALDQPEPFNSFDSSPNSLTPSQSSELQPQSVDELIKKLNHFYDLIKKANVAEDIALQAFKQIFYLICAQSLNQLLIRRDLCQFRKAMQISFNLSCLVQWSREHYLVNWRELVEQLDPITQATKLLQTRKSREDIGTIEEVCNKLNPPQIIKILSMYSSSYEERITTDFIRELEEHLYKKRENVLDLNNNNNNDIFINTRHFFKFVDA